MTLCHLLVLFVVGYLITYLHLKLFYLLNSVLVPPTQSRKVIRSSSFLPHQWENKPEVRTDCLFCLRISIQKAEYSSPFVPITLLQTTLIWSPYFNEIILSMGIPWMSSGRKAPKEEVVWDDLVLVCEDYYMSKQSRNRTRESLHQTFC